MSTIPNSQSDVELMSEVLQKTPSAIMVIDEGGIIRKANPAALSLLNESYLEGRKWVEVISTVFRPRNDDGHEISTRDGRRCQVVTVPLHSGHLIQVTDLTETRLLQDKLSHMERLSSLGRMAASLAHQIRTPLSAAILYAANLGNANLQESARKRFQEKLMSRLEALEAQVSDILMFARSNEQTAKLTDATSVADQAANNVTAVLTKGEARLDVQIEDEGLEIMCNATALTGAISNLIANAVEAGGHNIILNLSKDGDRAVFAVANDGPRIPEELKEKIFEPFYTSKPSGTGLGLAVVTAVTKVHQGILRLDSWDNTFATVFEISIPLHKATEEDSAQQIAAVTNATTHTHSQSSSNNTLAHDGAASAALGAGTLSGQAPSSAHASATSAVSAPMATSSAATSTQSASAAASATELLRATSMGAHKSATENQSNASAMGSNDTKAVRSILTESAHGNNRISETAIGTGSIDVGVNSFASSSGFSSYDNAEDFASEASDLSNALRHGSSFASIANQDVGYGHDASSGMSFMANAASSQSLPKTAAGISSQQAHAANSATSEAFAAYARKQQSLRASENASTSEHNTFSQVVHTDVSGFNQVEVKVDKSHKLLDASEQHKSNALESNLNVDGTSTVKDPKSAKGSAVGAANAVFAAAVRSQKRRSEDEI
ncbi:PAS domain-containing sensor histidine kinase [uncultured Anaerobiospirillum sp.]|uniref:sensor histidine kinase n=1 Tax=uncultured Anaerobiospirillum sp. TaxID=265728 RepID=UPI0028039A48|nr:PAS domain-containing sensor histidine kinase [uncultured Anaerobiospirillum sp.]